MQRLQCDDCHLVRNTGNPDSGVLYVPFIGPCDVTNAFKRFLTIPRLLTVQSYWVRETLSAQQGVMGKLMAYGPYFILVPSSVQANTILVVLGGLMLSVLVTGHKVRRFKRSQGWWIFMSNKNPNHAFLRRWVKPDAPCSKILRHAKDPFEVWKNIIRKAKFITSLASSSCFAARWFCW
jgi:hypothetical protein